MNDFERQLQDALKGATSDYSPSDPYEAKTRFMTRFRRRRLAVYAGSTALAGAAAALAFFLVPARLDGGSLPPAASLGSRQLGAISVGGTPAGIAFGSDVVWVANPGTGLVQRIGPLSNQIGKTYDIGGSPDDVSVGVGAAWVSDSSAGTVTKIPLEGGAPIVLEVAAAGSALDVAPGAGAVWVASEADGLLRIDPVTDVVTSVDTGIEGVEEVAAGQGSVIVAGTEALVRIDPVTQDPTSIDALEPSDNRDLRISEGAVWVADGDAGEVTRYDLVTGRASEPVFVGGEFTAIASGDDAMWMITGDEGDEGNLTRIDLVTARVIGEPVSIGGRPVDLTTGAGSVWVVSIDSGSVVRIDPNALPTP